MIFGRYRILSEISRGAMGIVYKGMDTSLDREVALKRMVINPILDEQLQREYIQRFINEAKIIAKLNHPNIVTVYEAGEFEGEYYIVMEYLEGRDLSEYMEDEAWFDLASSINIIIHIGSALEFAHQYTVHRDVKPSNIMILNNGMPKIMDFGIAKVIDNKTMTATGLALGTVGYMSPEQMDSDAKIDSKSDIFSLCVVLYQLVAHQKPYPGDSLVAYIAKIMDDRYTPPPPRTINPEVPASLETVIANGLIKDRDYRYQTAGELVNDLKLVLNEMMTGEKAGVVDRKPKVAVITQTESSEEPNTDSTTTIIKTDPNRKTKPIPKGIKSLLVIAMVAVVFITGFIYPGFFINLPTPTQTVVPPIETTTSTTLTPTNTTSPTEEVSSTPITGNSAFLKIPKDFKGDKIYYRSMDKKISSEFLNEKWVEAQKSEVALEIKPETYILTIYRKGYENQKLDNQKFEAGKTYNIEDLLKGQEWVKKQVKLTIRVKNTSAKVKIFDQARINPPKTEKLTANEEKTIDLDSGNYKVSANADGFYEKKMDIDLTNNEKKTITISLIAIPPPEPVRNVTNTRTYYEPIRTQPRTPIRGSIRGQIVGQ